MNILFKLSPNLSAWVISTIFAFSAANIVNLLILIIFLSRYTKEVLAGNTAVLEFETTVEGKYVNGVDIITCNDAGKIIEFRVMSRPLQAINLVHKQMGEMLERLNTPN